MINELKISNFKSVKKMEVKCKRVNVLLGGPNVGKSNILEGLGLFQAPGLHFRVIRCEKLSDLFFDGDISHEINITTDSSSVTVKSEGSTIQFESLIHNLKSKASGGAGGNGWGAIHGQHLVPDYPFRFYTFNSQVNFNSPAPSPLLPPDGPNLVAVLMADNDLKRIASDFFKPYGLRLVIKPRENRIEIVKDLGDVLINYPYNLSADTLRRMLFYRVAIETNKNATLIFEEPESGAFPYYTKQLGELIGMEESNQYFLSTHNPYLVEALISKTDIDDLAVFVVYYQDYRTKVRPLNSDEIRGLLDEDPLLSLDKYAGD